MEILLIIKNLNSNLVILKTELIYKLNIKKMSLKELEHEIANFIDYYNNVRIQKKLNWMDPSKYIDYLYNKNIWI